MVDMLIGGGEGGGVRGAGRGEGVMTISMIQWL